MNDKKIAPNEKLRLMNELARLQKEVAIIKEQISDSTDLDISNELTSDVTINREITTEDRLFLAIVKQAPFTMWASKGKEGNYEITLWNEGAEKIYGFKKDTALGKNYLDLFINDLEREESAADCEEVIQGQEFRNFLATDIAADGSRRIMLTNCFRIWDGTEYLQAEVGLDVSELESSEEEYRTLREYGIEKRETSHRLEVFEQFRKITSLITSPTIYEDQGLQKVLEQIVTFLDNLIGEETFSAICLYGDHRSTANYSVCIFNQPQHAKENQLDDILLDLGKYALTVKHPCFIDAANQKPEGFPEVNIVSPIAVLPLLSRGYGVGIIYVEMRKDYEFKDDAKEVLKIFADQAAIAVQTARFIQNLQKLNKDIAEKQEVLTRSQIAVDFAHRMNNMAAPFLMWVDLIEEELDKDIASDDALVKEYLEEIKTQSKELLQEAKKIEVLPNTVDIDIVKLLEAMVRNIRIQSRDISVDLVIPPELYSVNAIQSLLSNAIWNVVSNALDAMNYSGNIKIYAANKKRNNKNWVEIIVKDSGPGIPQEIIPSIFESNYSTKGEGHGYGLWRTKEILKGLGGDITLQSSNQDGTVFEIVIPSS